MFRIVRVVVVVLGIAVLARAEHATAQAGKAPLQPPVERLLEVGWPRSLKARADAEEQYRRLAGLAQTDARIPYAYALVQLRQFRYPEAAKLLDQVMAADASNLPARQLRVWLAVITKDYGKALTELPRVAELLPADEAAGDAEMPHLEVAGFLGRIAGYLEGPVREGVDQAARAAALEKALGLLTTRRKAAFQNGRKAVLQQFAALGEEAELTAAEAKEKADKLKERMVGDLARKSEELAARAEAEQDRLEKLKEDLTYEMDKIDSEERSLLPAVQQAQVQAAAARRDLRTIDDRVAHLYDLAQREKDPVRQQFYLDDAAAWRLRRNERGVAVREADRRMAELAARLAPLQQKRRDLDARWQRESGLAEKLQGTLKRAQTDKEKLERQPTSGVTSQVRDQKRRSLALTSYIALPVSLEDEKARILASFR